MTCFGRPLWFGIFHILKKDWRRLLFCA